MAEKEKKMSEEKPVVEQEDLHPEGTKVTPDSILEARRPLVA